MLNWFARRLQDVHNKDKTGQGGFTLIELLVVVIIIGILAAIAIPTFLSQREKSQKSTVKSDVRNAVTAHATLVADNGSGIPNGTYTEDNPIAGPAGTVAFTPSKGVTLVVGSSTDPTDRKIKGSYTGVTGTYDYDTATGKYTTTGGF